MKFKLLVLFIFVFSVSVFPQEMNYEIETYLEDTAIEKSSSEINARVIIKNKAEETLLTSRLQRLYFHFSKCPIETVCKKSGDIYTASAQIPFKKIREDKSFEFTVNLADLFWMEGSISHFSAENKKNFSVIPKDNIYFYAGTKTLDGYKKKNKGPLYDSNGKLIRVVVKKTPIYKEINSNVVDVTLN